MHAQVVPGQLMERERFYRRVVGELSKRSVLRPDMSVIVVGGGELDRRVLLGQGFENVTLSNVDAAQGNVENAEALSYADASFDFGIVSAALHHCRSPHRALLELYRVSRVGVLALEARDSMLMRIANRLGVAEEYELSAVAIEGFLAGGVANSPVPNYVYRWTEREVDKTIRSAAPERNHRLLWFREFELPPSILEVTGKSVWRHAQWPLRALVAVFPSQANLFGFAVLKEDLQPWMKTESEPDIDEMRKRLGGVEVTQLPGEHAPISDEFRRGAGC
jgi:SAM-dependent methyltransferase